MSSCSHSTCETPFCPWCGVKFKPNMTDGEELYQHCRDKMIEASVANGDWRTWQRRMVWVHQQLDSYQRNREAGR